MSSYKPPSLRLNIVANFLGRFSGMALGILFTPFYIHFLGIEAYGLIGFYLTLQGSMTFLEMGLGRACNRELARLSGQGRGAADAMRTTLRTLELVYWVIALCVGGGLALLSPWIASTWLETVVVSQQALADLLVIIAWVIALRWPVGLYQGALMGLQQHVILNLLQVSLSLLMGGGAVLALWRISATIETYFVWQLMANGLGVVLFAFLAWRKMPRFRLIPRPSFHVLRQIYQFAAGVGFNAVLGTVLRQADKLILSAMLPMKQFGYYALASLIAQVVAMVADVVSNAAYPRFSQLLGADAAEDQIAKLYHLVSQMVAVLIIPFALSLALYSEEALYVYTGDNEIAQNTAVIFSILVMAKMLHASMIVPYALQLAYGWVKLSIYLNIISVVWLLPALYWGVQQYGATGAALAWLMVTIGYVLIGLPLMHRKLLPGQAWRWFSSALLLPATVVAAWLSLCQQMEFSSHRWMLASELIVMGCLATLLAAMTSQSVRQRLFHLVKLRTQ